MATDHIAENSAPFARLAEKNRAFALQYPGPTPDRQPVHTVYGGAHLFRAETAQRLGGLALDALTTYAVEAATETLDNLPDFAEDAMARFANIIQPGSVPPRQT